tara:strand:+ start:2035 stop:2232 length:198 start_codon:yes stop_codon:yes gene_type:complete
MNKKNKKNIIEEQETFTVTLEENPDNPEELFLPIPDAILNQLAIKENDIVNFEILENKTVKISKK